jgi:hypothetical protein
LAVTFRDELRSGIGVKQINVPNFNSRSHDMFGGLILVCAVLAAVLMCGYLLGDVSGIATIMITATWMTLFGLTVVMGWPVAVIIAGTVVLAIATIRKVFGGDIRSR